MQNESCVLKNSVHLSFLRKAPFHLQITDRTCGPEVHLQGMWDLVGIHPCASTLDKQDLRQRYEFSITFN